MNVMDKQEIIHFFSKYMSLSSPPEHIESHRDSPVEILAQRLTRSYYIVSLTPLAWYLLIHCIFITYDNVISLLHSNGYETPQNLLNKESQIKQFIDPSIRSN